ncbi:SHOCT domain-containing protein [Candidatus Bathyarchaeota archaeon]|nr:SHOCT domain-containing protein [Candidatus Bathyarchaeota archaeon]
MWPWMWGGMGMGWGMWIWFLLFIGCGWLFFMWWPRSYRYRPYQRYEEDPLEVAQMRLAKGEITPEEFERIRSKIES